VLSELLCRNILITDDNEGVREALVSALRARGYNAVGAVNGRDAIKKLSGLKEPTLIFLDLMMPVLNGWDVLEAWQKDPAFAHNRVVTISAVNLRSRTDAPIPKNTSGTLQKPVTFQSVYSFVQKYCGPALKSAPRAEAGL
jgi:CheY-like chemotaxis protein